MIANLPHDSRCTGCSNFLDGVERSWDSVEVPARGKTHIINVPYCRSWLTWREKFDLAAPILGVTFIRDKDVRELEEDYLYQRVRHLMEQLPIFRVFPAYEWFCLQDLARLLPKCPRCAWCGRPSGLWFGNNWFVPGEKKARRYHDKNLPCWGPIGPNKDKNWKLFCSQRCKRTAAREYQRLRQSQRLFREAKILIRDMERGAR